MSTPVTNPVVAINATEALQVGFNSTSIGETFSSFANKTMEAASNFFANFKVPSVSIPNYSLDNVTTALQSAHTDFIFYKNNAQERVVEAIKSNEIGKQILESPLTASALPLAGGVIGGYLIAKGATRILKSESSKVKAIGILSAGALLATASYPLPENQFANVVIATLASATLTAIWDASRLSHSLTHDFKLLRKS